jgi:hypothetical protein
MGWPDFDDQDSDADDQDASGNSSMGYLYHSADPLSNLGPIQEGESPNESPSEDPDENP